MKLIEEIKDVGDVGGYLERELGDVSPNEITFLDEPHEGTLDEFVEKIDKHFNTETGALVEFEAGDFYYRMTDRGYPDELVVDVEKHILGPYAVYLEFGSKHKIVDSLEGALDVIRKRFERGCEIIYPDLIADSLGRTFTLTPYACGLQIEFRLVENGDLPRSKKGKRIREKLDVVLATAELA